MLKKAAYQTFAEAEEAIRRGDEPFGGDPVTVTAELDVARRLRRTAPSAVPDPEFVDALRAEIQLRVASGKQPAGTIHYAALEAAVGLLGIAYHDGKVLYCAALEADEAVGNRQPPVGSTTPPTAYLPASGASELPAASRAFERMVAQQLGAWPVRDPALPPELERAVRDALAGRRRFAAVDLSWLSPFQQRVLEKTAEIPRGEMRPYGWIAREIGAPGAVRAVGTALGHNPIPFLIPCHRVVRSDGSLGEYSGGGPVMKERVLELEGAPVQAVLRAARAGERYRGSATTKIVCYPSCHAARRIRPENVVPFASLTEAGTAGYRPCALCRPA
jgi:O-6-methylguanine DNA methyltransferase